jgi:hypothetical protein
VRALVSLVEDDHHGYRLAVDLHAKLPTSVKLAVD